MSIENNSLPINIGTDAVGTNILASELNPIIDKVNRVVGTGDGNYGYGEDSTVFFNNIQPSNTINTIYYDGLRTVMLAARQHQTGVDESANLTDLNSGDTITWAQLTQYQNYANTIETDRLVCASNQRSLHATNSVTSGVWNGRITCRLTVEFFFGYEYARNFFNSGGYITASCSVPGGGAKNDTWATMLSEAGAVVINSSNFYGLSGTAARFISKGAAAGVYVENRYYVDVYTGYDSTRFKIFYNFYLEDNDTGDQQPLSSGLGPAGPAVDENVNAATASAAAYKCTGAITPTVFVEPSIGFNSWSNY